jgi:hypothetical protein
MAQNTSVLSGRNHPSRFSTNSTGDQQVWASNRTRQVS